MKTKHKKRIGPVRAAILNWMGVPLSLTNGDFWGEWLGSNNTAGQTVNEKTVLSLSAAWACNRLISESIGSLPLNLYERTSSGRRVAENHPLQRILHIAPNSKSSPITFWESNVSAILMNGNSLSEQQEIGGRLVGLKFLQPSRIVKNTDSLGNYQLKYIEDDGKQRTLNEKKLLHIPGFSVNGKWGLSAISYGASVFGSALAAGQAANKSFENSIHPAVFFSIDKLLKAEQRTEFRKMLTEVQGAWNSGKSPLLEAGMDAKVIGINPTDVQLLESRNFSVEEVCRFFLVDPSMVGFGGKDSNFGTGLEQKTLRFLTFTLRPYLKRIEEAINRQLLTPAEQERYYAEFNIEGLLRADSAGRAAFYSVMVNNGIYTRDEVRAKENMELRGGNADVLTVQSAMTPLDTIGQNNSSETARTALAAWLNEQDGKDGNNE